MKAFDQLYSPGSRVVRNLIDVNLQPQEQELLDRWLEECAPKTTDWTTPPSPGDVLFYSVPKDLLYRLIRTLNEVSGCYIKAIDQATFYRYRDEKGD